MKNSGDLNIIISQAILNIIFAYIESKTMISYYLRSLYIINNIGFSEKIGYFNLFALYKYIVISIIFLSASFVTFVPTAFAESLLNSSSLMINSTDIEKLYNEGLALQKLQRYNESIEDDDKVLAIDPKHVGALNKKANILQNLEKYGEAIEYYDKVIVIDPTFNDALNNKAFTLIYLEKYNESLQD